MFVVSNPNRAVAPLQSTNSNSPTQPTDKSPSAVTPMFEASRFEATTRAQNASSYFPTNAELTRPTTASVINITTGDRQPLNPAQMSSEQGIDFVQQRLASLGFNGSLTAANTTSPTTGPFRIDYGNDDRRHWDIGGMNVGLVLNLYANNPPEVADRMLAADMQHARSGAASWEEEGTPRVPPNLVSPSTINAPSQSLAPFRMLPGARPTPPSASSGVRAETNSPPYIPTRDELLRPTTATSVNILTGERVGLNPGQMSSDQGVDFVRARLAAVGYRGAGNVSNQTAPTSGPFGIDYGTDNRRHWDIDGMNVGLTLQMYANNPRQVADRMLADLVRQMG